MELSNEQLAALKSKELELFKAFISVCSQLNLPYFIVGGTLLGAVRHKGFIPWDDDIDIAMLREDYEVFLSKAQQYLPEEFFLQTIDTDPEYLANFAKLRHSGTTFLESSVKHCKINHGIYIDIFPLDNYPDSAVARALFQLRNSLYRYRIIAAFHDDAPSAVKRIICAFLKVLFPSVRKVLCKRDRLLKSCSHGTCIASHCGAWGKKEIVPAQWYQETTTVEFEGLQVSAPKDYHAFLTHYYGDYMKLPPVEKQKSHHFTEIIDLEKSYKEYM